MSKGIPKIVITGGPCSGKTTGLAYLMEKLSDLGFNVFIIPEVATMLITSGFDPRKLNSTEEILSIEEAMFETQMALEKIFEEKTKKISFDGKKSVILQDRGIMDIKAYIPPDCEGYFTAMAENCGLSEVRLRDCYTGVIHLITAAEGAENFYTLENNKARLEGAEQAKAADKATKRCWIGHPHFKIIDNRTDFEGKMKRTFAAICQLLGIPTPLEIERKFLVKKVDLSKLPHHQIIEIEQMYLACANEKEEQRIRKRGQNGSFIYFLTQKILTKDPRVRNEIEKIITPEKFIILKKSRDTSKNIIKKDRICFPWKNQYFELDFFKEPEHHSQLILLEIELTEQNDKVIIPPFIEIEKEVTGDRSYSNIALALNNR